MEEVYSENTHYNVSRDDRPETPVEATFLTIHRAGRN